MKKIISFLLIFAFGLSSCEKDDICDPDTPTTPRLVITFYDINNSTVRKRVTNLMVIGKDQKEAIVFNKTATDDTRFLTSGDSIAIPLRTDADTTTYKFTINSGNPNASLINSDEITFVHSRQNSYVSRACGFKTIFNLSAFQRADPAGDSVWMQDIFIINPNIEYENETHVKVFF
ncbi:hypothetical protein D0817_04230 [Flavobacterium cupreum]|uniref:Uncharacterized protein n=1 Tax=Flavobacterium cupreum TaxID=2133766 RepID=A0A434ABV5_9FLAO|nr:DUF6452 family protein [Flavobacterium cupreum]RUT71899.1 hypothetical protein D0817_04230 [Flavobacterium cupreum]